MSEFVAEHKGLTVLVCAVIVFSVVIAVVQPEPIQVITKRIQVSLRMWQLGIEVTDVNGNPISQVFIVLNKTTVGNETLINPANYTLLVKNTGQLPVNLTIMIDGKESGYVNPDTGESYDGWFLNKEGKNDFVNSVVHVTCNYAGQVLDVGDSVKVVFTFSDIAQESLPLNLNIDIVPTYISTIEGGEGK
ncbi:MAG: hypothetical protein ACTSPB_13745 [Candidatus Thorarchaeota archaeon]